MRPVFPELLATMAVPKAEELVAAPHRHGGKENAEQFFLQGMTRAMHRLAEQAHPAAPITIYYAFKQSETKSQEGTSSLGWEMFLEAVNRAGLVVTGTWPMRTERDYGVKSGSNVSFEYRSCMSSARNECRNDFKEAIHQGTEFSSAGRIGRDDPRK